jgi:membrane glycosyltransferase
MLPPPRRPGVDPINVPLLTGTARLAEATTPSMGWKSLSSAEKMAVLSDSDALCTAINRTPG